ncbi:MAG: imidazole glycerol phosphate synthase subunit HisF [Flavipsychrobacter sp.]
MLTKRIIPCLDIKDGRVVKGVNFESLKDMGDPVELATYYTNAGADELVFLDITATNEKRKTLVSLVSAVAIAINIPFTVGGGIGTLTDVHALLNAGADKVSINSAAITNPKLIIQLAKAFGSQCLVVAIDVRFIAGNWIVYTRAGTHNTGINLFNWIKQVADLGAGEILLTSINHDGTKNGFAIEMLRHATSITNLPIIASGGAGNAKHFKEVFVDGRADAALAAGIFHSKTLEMVILKKYLINNNINIRL